MGCFQLVPVLFLFCIIVADYLKMGKSGARHRIWFCPFWFLNLPQTIGLRSEELAMPLRFFILKNAMPHIFSFDKM